MPELHPDLKKLVDFLQDIARKLIAKKAFFPTGASLEKNGTLILEYIPPAENLFETRKLLHGKLVQIARSGKVSAVGLCHSLENPQIGAAIVVSVDHTEVPPLTLIIPIEVDSAGETKFRGEPMFQQAAYSFFRYVDADEAKRLILGDWKQENPVEGPPGEYTFSADGSFDSTSEKGVWIVEKGDFFSMLLEQRKSGTRQRRIVEMTPSRILLQEVVSGMVRQEEYRKTSANIEQPALSSESKKPWWKIW